MEFIITQHAQRRLRQRGIEPPSGELNLRPIGKKTLRAVRESCKFSAKKKGTVYFKLNKFTIYVCKPVGVAKYILITAFNIKK